MPSKFEQRLLLTMWLAWAVALATNGVLAWQVSLGGTLPGCSLSGLDCGAVIASPYGRIFGYSITYYAFAYFAVMGAILFAVMRTRSRPAAALLAFVLPTFGLVGVVTGIWSLHVMIVELNQLCLWCVIVHIANGFMFLVAIVFARYRWRRIQSNLRQADTSPLSRRPIVVAFAAAIFLGIWQFAFLSQFHDQYDLNVVEVPGVKVPLSILSIDSAESAQTVKGNFNAPHRVTIFTCFTCPFCRDLYRQLVDIQSRHPGQLRIDVRMCPLWRGCNRLMSARQEPEHQHACELATISLAVASIQPEAFSDFADWLYDNQEKMTSKMAAKEARRRVDADEFNRIMELGRLSRRLADDVDLATQVNVKTLPAIYLANGQVAGSFSAESLDDLLSREFGWPKSKVQQSTTGG